MFDRPPRENDPNDQGPSAARWARSSALGLQVVLTFVLLSVGGAWLDEKYGWEPWGTLGGIGLGLFALFSRLFREAGVLKSQATREREAREAASKDESDRSESSR